eukprot:TRINITY_DN3922_c1_g1_i3.p1 TRINITY_DN3922_c1_g1~~TRINITY_DN3922_c1_g1_i3.p1  ORF type:complete len:207 (-),score=57.72 TRINITY_DN3922_c1_g1_i3:50-589(-)
MSVSCSDSSFATLRAFSIIHLLLYGFGGLLGLFWLMKRNPESFGFLTKGYKPERFYWDLVVTVRKIVFAIVSLFASAPLQLFFGTWILLLSWIAHHFAKPYESEMVTKMESASLWVLLVTVTTGMLFYTDVLGTTDPDGFAVSILLMLLNLGAILVFLFLAAHKGFKPRSKKETELAVF